MGGHNRLQKSLIELRESFLGMHGCVCCRRAPRWSNLVQSLTPVARRGWHKQPAPKCHTYILTVTGQKAGSVAYNTAARISSHATDRRRRWAGAVHRHRKYCKLSQTIANDCTPRHRAKMSPADAAIRLQPSCAAREQVGAVPYRTGTPCMARPTGGRMSYVHPGRQRCQWRLCRV